MAKIGRATKQRNSAAACAECRELIAENGEEGSALCCLTCRLVLVCSFSPHVRRDVDDETDRLCGFNVVDALNTLKLLMVHGCHTPERKAGAHAAYCWLLEVREHAGPERNRETRYVESLNQLASALGEFLSAADEQEASERQRDEHTSGYKPSPRPHEVTAHAVGLAKQLEQQVLQQRGRVCFSSEGRVLPGTDQKPGQKGKMLLARLELTLADSGFSVAEIGKLNLDKGGPNGAADRVKKRLRSAREAVGQYASSPAGQLVAALEQAMILTELP